MWRKLRGFARATMLALALLIGSPALAGDDCTPGWAVTGSGLGGFSPHVYELSVFDDGSGLALYAGGQFVQAGGNPVNYIARWDGSSWSSLASGLDGFAYALTEFDDGTGPALYAGGEFTNAGGQPASNIARWDGSAWSPLGSGVNGPVRALAVFDDGSGGGPALYAGGQFTQAGGVSAFRLAKWNGSTWSAVGLLGGDVYSLCVYDDGSGPALYAGGLWTFAGGIVAPCIAKWNGTSWSSLAGPGAPGTDGVVFALTVFDDGTGPALYAGGAFTQAGGTQANSIARWAGAGWSALSGPNGSGFSSGLVNELTVFDDGAGPALYAGGDFIAAGGVEANRVAKWNGSAWSALAGPSGNGMNNDVRALIVFDDGSGPALHAGGDFTTAGGIAAVSIAKWQGCSDTPACPPDLAEPFGVLDLADIVAFVSAFAAQDPAADFAEPFGVFDLADVVAFVTAFEAGCP